MAAPRYLRFVLALVAGTSGCAPAPTFTSAPGDVAPCFCPIAADADTDGRPRTMLTDGDGGAVYFVSVGTDSCTAGQVDGGCRTFARGPLPPPELAA